MKPLVKIHQEATHNHFSSLVFTQAHISVSCSLTEGIAEGTQESKPAGPNNVGLARLCSLQRYSKCTLYFTFHCLLEQKTQLEIWPFSFFVFFFWYLWSTRQFVSMIQTGSWRTTTIIIKVRDTRLRLVLTVQSVRPPWNSVSHPSTHLPNLIPVPCVLQEWICVGTHQLSRQEAGLPITSLPAW